MNKGKQLNLRVVFDEGIKLSNIVLIINVCMEQQFISEQCSLYQMSSHETELFELQQYSSLNVNGLGNFEECVAQSTHRYFLWEYQISQYTGTFLSGICYNYSCNSYDLKYMVKAFNSYIPVPAHIQEVSQIVKNEQTLQGYQWAFLSVLMIVLVVGLMGTLINHYSLLRAGKIARVCEALSYEKSIKIFSQPTNNNQRHEIMISLRAIAFILMIAYNTSLLLLSHPSLAQNYKSPLSNCELFSALTYFGFDIWFFVSGFTMTVQLSKNWQKNHSKKFGILIFLRRIIQIWVFAVLTVLYIKILLPTHGEGPLWYLAQRNLDQYCDYSIGYFLLFSNLIFKSCNYYLWVWDVTIQVSAFGMCLFFLRVSKIKYKNILYILANALFLLGAVLLALFDTRQIDFQFGMIQGWLYRIPLIRGLAYLIGINFGLFYFKFRANRLKYKMLICRIMNYRIMRALSTLTGMSIIAFIVYYFKQMAHLVEESQLKSIYTLGSSVFLVLGIICIILPSILGFNGPVKILFKGFIFNYISKLSFSAYSVSYCLTIFFVFNATDNVTTNLMKIVVMSSAILCASLFVGSILCVTFEMVIYRMVQNKLRGQTRKFVQFF